MENQMTFTAQNPSSPARHWRIGSSLLLILMGLFMTQSIAASQQLRIAVLKFGTANWEISTLRHHGLDQARGFELEPLEFAGKQATMVAFQSGAADIALTDWLWVSRQRAAGKDFSFIPFSTAVGSLVVPRDSAIRSLSDLAGKRVGIAGGALDKNWLLFRALAIRMGIGDLADKVTPVFGAPPLLNHQLETGRVDAVINFWHYVARLKAKGMRVVMSAQEAASELGIADDLPLVGYVFDAGWARANRKLFAGFVESITRARAFLADSDTEWNRLKPLMNASSKTEFTALRDGYRSGIPPRLNQSVVDKASRLMAALGELGGEELVGRSGKLTPGTFWEADAD
jgi:NitT/TauT family transport system substrate-binding protein